MPLFDKKQHRRIRRVIEDHLTTFMNEAYEGGFIDNAYLMGKLTAYTVKTEYESLALDAIPNPKKTPLDKHILRHLLYESTNTFQNLGADIEKGVFDALLKGNRHQFTEDAVRAAVRGELAEAYTSQMTYERIVDHMSKVTRTVDLNWNKIVTTELWSAKLHGQASAILAKEGKYEGSDGPDTLVTKPPSGDACVDCRRLYLADDGKPKVFKLSELMANGSNAGLRRAQWKPTLGPCHPSCTCPLHTVTPT